MTATGLSAIPESKKAQNAAVCAGIVLSAGVEACAGNGLARPATRSKEPLKLATTAGFWTSRTERGTSRHCMRRQAAVKSLAVQKKQLCYVRGRRLDGLVIA